jgi:hypothetical protein
VSWGTLTAAAAIGDATLTVSSVASYPDPTIFTTFMNFRLRVGNEFMVCTGVDATHSKLTVVRGQDGTPATTHSVGDSVVPEDRSGAVYDAFATGVLAATTVYGAVNNLIAAVNTGGGGRIVFPAATYPLSSGLIAQNDVELHLMKGAWLQKTYSAAAGLPAALVTNASLSTKVVRFAITGPGKLGCTSLSLPGTIIGLWGDQLRLEDFTVDTYGGVNGPQHGGNAVDIGGDRIRVRCVTVTNAYAGMGAGGIRMFGGNSFVAIGCHVESGDDALQFAPLSPSSESVLKDMSIARGTYIGCTGFSSAARFIAVTLVDATDPGSMSASITDCSFVSCRGQGTVRRAVVYNTDSSGTIRDVDFLGCSFGSYATLGTLAADVTTTTATTISVNETAQGAAIPGTPFVIQIGAEQMQVTARTAGPPATYTVTRGYNSTTAALHFTGDAVVNVNAGITPSSSAEIHLSGVNTVGGTVTDVRFVGVRVLNPHYASVLVDTASGVSDLLFEDLETAVGNLDVTVPQVQIGGVTRVTLRNGILAPQASGNEQVLVGSGSTMTGLLIDACRFKSIGNGVLGVSCVAVTRPVIERCSFETTGSGTAIRIGSGCSGALIADNDLSSITAATPITDLASDTICQNNLGYSDRRMTRTVTTAYTVATNDDLIWVDATSAAVTVTLPSATQTTKGKSVTVKKIDSSAHAVSVHRTGTDLVDGAASVSLASQYNAVQVKCDGSASWYTVAKV